jgi:O-antigen/teichoic acid export membrane protein
MGGTVSVARRALLSASLEQYGLLLINLCTIATLARLLSPTEIGISVIGMGISTIVFSLREFATAEFLIQKHTIEKNDVQTSFTILLGLSLILGAGLYTAKPALAQFYKEPGLESFLTLTIICALIDVMTFPKVALLRRDLAFGTIARLRTASLAVTSSSTIILAVLGHSYMSYAWGMLLGVATNAVLTLVAQPVTLYFKPNLKSWREVVEFGRYRGATEITDRMYDALPQLVLGRVMPATAVGIYNRANAVCTIPDRMLLGAIFSVSFPALVAQVRNGKDVRASYVRSLCYITALYWPSLALLAILAHPVVNTILGSSWDQAIPIVQILALSSIFWFPCILTSPMLLALGKNRDAFLSNILSRFSGATVLCAASTFGLTTMAASQLVAIPLQMLISFHYVRKHAPFSWAELLSGLWRSAAVTMGALAGPMVLIASTDFHFDMPLSQAVIAAMLAIPGWLAALALTQHLILSEIARLPGMSWIKRQQGISSVEPEQIKVGVAVE